MPHVQHMSSTDLVHWSRVHDAVPRLPAWASPGPTWAPEVLRRGSQYVLFYTVHHRTLNLQCVSTATASTAAGPFTDNSTGPFLCQTTFGGSIDPSPFVAPNGRVYLLWESATQAGGPAAIYAQELRSDGHALVGARARLVIAARAWEGGNIEGPAMAKGPSGYYLFYSANYWASAKYAIGYAICVTPLGGCSKVTTVRPWVSSNQFMAGPGGQSFFRDLAGALRMVYHAWSPGKVGYQAGGARSLWIGHIGFDVTGRPVLTA